MEREFISVSVNANETRGTNCGDGPLRRFPFSRFPLPNTKANPQP